MIDLTPIVSYSAEETLGIGKKIASSLQIGDTLYLTGDLGAGKTSFLKGCIAELTGVEPEEIISPTFTYVQIYEIPHKPLVYHFDFYRIESPVSTLTDWIDTPGIYCIEWPEKLPQASLPSCERLWSIHIAYRTENTRLLTFSLGKPHAS